jgi:hypothetical protein
MMALGQRKRGKKGRAMGLGAGGGRSARMNRNFCDKERPNGSVGIGLM